MTTKFEDCQKLVSGNDLTAAQTREIVDKVAAADPEALPALCLLLANQKSRLQADLRRSKQACREAKDALGKLTQTPWFPGEVIGVRSDGRLDVAAGGRRQVIGTASGIDLKSLGPGDEVFLNSHLTAVVACNEHPPQTGLVGTVIEVSGERVIVRGVAEDRLSTLCNAKLAATLRPGDQVLYRPETHCVIARLPQPKRSDYELANPPSVTFDDVGGLDDLILRLKRELEPHLIYPELVSKYSLQLLRGITLVGPPGIGKTMIAAALTRHIAISRPGTRILHIKPGALRGMYYGQTEQRIREVFAVARRCPDLVVIFLDELDNFGTRGTGIGHEIDARVLCALLDEIEGLDPADNVFCIAATNRLDLCDDALVRGGRLGGAIFQIPRPNRQAAQQIFAKYLRPNLPYKDGRGAVWLAETAVSYLYAPNAGAGKVCTVTLANGDRREIKPSEIMSGALIANAVERAKHSAANRHLEGNGGIALEDLLHALDEALTAEGEKLKSPHKAARALGFPGASEIVRVELPQGGRLERHQYLLAV